MNRTQLLGYHLLRLAAASVFLIHSLTRLTRGVDDFTPYWQETFGTSASLGLAISWAVTLTELAGGLCIAAGRFVTPFAAWFALQLAAGVVTIHGREGWFVVGAGRNGMEYSVLIIACLASIVLLQPKRILK